MFRIKICGVTTPADAAMIAGAGADAIGLNFYPPSPRSVEVEQAAAIRAAAGGLLAVGVFVNTPAEEIKETAERVGLSAVQLHGDEPPSTLAELADLPIVRARRMDDRGVDPIAADLAACQQAGRRPDALLVDAAAPGAFGGTGKTVDWTTLAGDRPWLGGTPLVLAGGLTPENVAEAIRVVLPHGVDTASGVESSPGVKDAELVRRFVAACRDELPPRS